MKKLFLVFSFIVLTASAVFAADGIMWGEKDIRVIKTEWFDIIYGSESAESAALLYENADRIYSEISEFFEYPIIARMPVVLSARTEMFNAYYTGAYRNHIVLFDTVPNGDMVVFSNSLLSTFRHELTHAFTYNLKNKFVMNVDKIVGDSISGSFFSITSGLAESATVTSESAYGEGRLNDEYAKQMVKQAKIEGQFPKYSDMKGSSDKYPGGSYYYFNGAFVGWLTKKYGVKKYSDFWYRCINLKSITAGGAFKKVYGMSINAAWALFQEELEVPEIKGNPLQEKIDGFTPADFFSGSKDDYSIKNLSGALYSSLSSTGDELVYTEEKTKTVWHVQKSEKNGSLKYKKLFSLEGLSEVKISDDGRFLVVYYTDYYGTTYHLKAKLYDLKKKRFIDIKGTGLLTGTVVQNGNDYYVVSCGFHSQRKWIDVKKVTETEKGGVKVEDYAVIPLEDAVKNLPVSFCQSGDGEFSVIISEALDYKLCTYSVADGKLLSEAKVPYERMVMRNLSKDPSTGKLMFSWTKPGSMPCLGYYDLQNKEFSLYEDYLSGGVYSPVMFDGNVVYTGHFFRQNRLFSVAVPSLSAAADGTKETSAFEIPAKEPYAELSDTVENVLSGSEKYNPFFGFKMGALGTSSVVSYNFNPDIDSGASMNLACKLPLGLSYAFKNPWDSNEVKLSAAYSPFTNSYGFATGFSGGTDTSLFKWNASLSTEFDPKGYKQAAGTFETTLTKSTGKQGVVGLSNKIGVYEGRSNATELTTTEPLKLIIDDKVFGSGSEEDNTFMVKDTVSLLYSNIHKAGTGVFEKGGVKFLISGTGYYHQNLEETMKYSDAHRTLVDFSVSPVVSACIPHLIPIENRDFYVYNLPASLNASLYPSAFNFITANANIYLFAMDIQKAIPGLSCIYINRFYFTLGYDYECAYENMDVRRGLQLQNTGTYAAQLVKGQLPDSHSAYLTANLLLYPNVGILTGHVPVNLQAEVRWIFKPYPGSKPDVKFSFNFLN